MSETHTVLVDVGQRFDDALQFAFQDAMQRRLRYHFLRLTLAGLDFDEEVPMLVELGRLAFEDADVSDQVRAIRERPGASPLAAALAEIVERAQPGDGDFARRAPVLVGAAIGAYAAIRDAGGPDLRVEAAVLGAIGGGTAAAVGGFVQEQISTIGPGEYVRTDEHL